jgi:hypothetical protein
MMLMSGTAGVPNIRFEHGNRRDGINKKAVNRIHVCLFIRVSSPFLNPIIQEATQSEWKFAEAFSFCYPPDIRVPINIKPGKTRTPTDLNSPLPKLLG